MAPRTEEFSVFDAFGAALSTLHVGEDGLLLDEDLEVNISDQDVALFNGNGRYVVIHEIAPHLSMEMRLRVFIAFRKRVSEALREKFGEKKAADYNAKSFDPLLIRKWFPLVPMESKIGLCGVGPEFSWTDEQKDFLSQLWEDFNSLISMEAGTNKQRKDSQAKPSFGYRDLLAEQGCMPCDPNKIQISDRFGERVEAVEKSLRQEHCLAEDAALKIEATLKQKQDFLEGVALEKFRSDLFDANTESGVKNNNVLAKMFSDVAKERNKAGDEQVDPKSIQERIFKDLVRLNDHFYILLPDLCRRLCDDKEIGLFSDKVQIMDRVAPHVSKQYRAEQTDLTMLENMRRLRFEREALATQLVDEIVNNDDDKEASGPGGLKLAKCPPGCVC